MYRREKGGPDVKQMLLTGTGDKAFRGRLCVAYGREKGGLIVIGQVSNHLVDFSQLEHSLHNDQPQ